MYEYHATLDRVVDGDTVDCWIDLGFKCQIHKRIRFYGLDTWECRTRNKEEKVKGLAAKARTKELLEGGKFKLLSHGLGKYGRVLGELFVEIDDEYKSVNSILLEEGHASSYYGGKKKKYKKRKKK